MPSFGVAKKYSTSCQALRIELAPVADFSKKNSILVFGMFDLYAICIIAQSRSLVGLRLDMAQNGIY